VEVKVPGEEPTTEQMEFIQEAFDDGVVAFYAWSVDVCRKQLARFGYGE